MTFKIVVSDPKTKKAYQKEVEKKDSGLIGKKVGDKFSGKVLGMDGYELEITGGSDKDGFPMRKDVSGSARKRVLLSFGPGFHPKRKGERKRKSIRGNTVAEDIAQLNVKVVKHGAKSVAASFGVEEPKDKPKKEEKTKTEAKPKTDEKPKEEKKADKPKDEAKGKEPKKEEPKKEEKKEETVKKAEEKSKDSKTEDKKDAKTAEKKDAAPKIEDKPKEDKPNAEAKNAAEKEDKPKAEKKADKSKDEKKE